MPQDPRYIPITANNQDDPMNFRGPTPGAEMRSSPGVIETILRHIFSRNDPTSYLPDPLTMAAGLPIAAQAAWKSRGIPKSLIEMLSEEKGPLQSLINKRDLSFHATDPDAAMSILSDRKILPNTDVIDSGVSVSRVPRISSKADKSVSFALRNSEMPKTRPLVENAYEKTHDYSNYTPEARERLGLPSKVEQGPIMNPRFEFENRTIAQPIQIQKNGELWVDMEALPPDPSIETWRFDAAPDFEARQALGRQGKELALNKLVKKAKEAGLSVRTFNSGREMHAARAAMGR